MGYRLARVECTNGWSIRVVYQVDDGPFRVLTEPGAYTVTQTVSGPGGRSSGQRVLVVDAGSAVLSCHGAALKVAGERRVRRGPGPA